MLPPDGIPYTYTGNRAEEDLPVGLFSVVLSSLVSIGLFLGAWALVRLLYTVLTRVLSNVPATPIYGIGVGIAALALGSLLYVLRERKRAVYACLELGAGFGTAVEAWIRLSPTPNTSALFISLLGSVYVIVRGLDNFAKARSE